MDATTLGHLKSTVGSLLYSQLSDEEDADRDATRASCRSFAVVARRRRNRLTIDIDLNESVSYVNGDSRMTIEKGVDELIVTKNGATNCLPVRELDEAFELAQILTETLGWRRQV